MVSAGRARLGAAGVMAFALTALPVAAASASPAEDISKWGIVCFCLHSKSTPQHIIKADDNGRLLYFARNGATKAQLRRQGLRVPDSQLKSLQYWSLLNRRGERYQTTFPILGPERMAALRPRIKALAKAIGPSLVSDAKSLKAVLDRQGYPRSHYAIVFSYVLDGLVWNELRRTHEFPSSYPTDAHPEWNGALWAFAPERPGVEGTNEIGSGNFALQSLWNERVLEALKSAAPATQIEPWLSDVAGGKTSAGASSLLVGDKGRLLVPLIHSSASDPIHGIGFSMARKVAEALNRPSGRQLWSSIPGASPDVGLLIVTHELMWDIIEQLDASGVVVRPPVLSGLEPANADTLRPLFYVVQR
jgi:hypothetical protein